MTTTALLVDILIIGIQVLLWTCGLLFSFVIDIHTLKPMLNDSSTLFLFLFIVASYSVGIIFDSIISDVFSAFKPKKEKDLYKDVRVVEIMARDKEVGQFINNHYERLRIARGTLINLPLLAISACCFINTNSLNMKISSCWATVIVILIGFTLTILARKSWKKRNETYLGYIRQIKTRLFPEEQ